jgi:hypothetical protein
MGTSVITVRVVGNHGCQRGAKDGDTLVDCGQPGCVDCQARRFVKQLAETGASIVEAHQLHWPDSEPHILDDLKQNKRLGHF